MRHYTSTFYAVASIVVLCCIFGRVQGQTFFQRSFRCINRLNEISKIDGVEQSFYLDGILSCYYQEPDLPNTIFNIPGFDSMPLRDSDKATYLSNSPMFDPNFENKVTLTQEQTQFFVFNSTPPALVTEKTHLTDVIPGMVWLVYNTRYSGNFKAILELQDFPFDSQTIYINITTLIPTTMGVFFTSSSFKDDFDLLAGVHEVIGWKVGSVREATEIFLQPNYGIVIPRLMYAVTVKRDPGYYVNKIIVGILMLTVLSHLLFLIKADDANRVMGCLTCLLGIITYLFVISSDVPKMAYSTRLDKFVNMSMYFVAGDMVIDLIEFRLLHKLQSDAEEAELYERLAIAEARANPISKEPIGEVEMMDDSTESELRLHLTSLQARKLLYFVARVMRRVDVGLAFLITAGYAIASGIILS
jgi:hypothetical protein